MADTSLNENRLGLLIWQTSNIWQSKLRKILKNHKISLNEYLIIETLFKLSSLTKTVSQIRIANNSSLDVSVVSTNLTLLENKNLILRTHIDNRSKNILLTDQGLSLISSLIKIIKNEEIEFFNKLGNETFNLTNSLKLLLGKKIRIKAYKNNE
jgi:DNA-binding MarR family transcriptional regulator|tara:strand:- start:40 stop:501 length:462 start_codon:yes stop_codon:yes gene_type:complete